MENTESNTYYPFINEKRELIVVSIEEFFKENDVIFWSKNYSIINGVKMTKRDIKPLLVKFYLKNYSKKWPGLHDNLYKQYKYYLMKNYKISKNKGFVAPKKSD